MKLLTSIMVIIALLSQPFFAQSGRITGVITDAKTMEPLIGVNIVVNEIKNTGATTDVSGAFAVRVPNGLYSITASLVGYQTVVRTDVVVTSASNPVVSIRLAETTVEMQQTVVTADYFDRSVQENNISTVTLAPEEIKRSPGSSQDFMRILQTMPGVSFSSDQTNELIVRGGSPNENLTILDGMEIHSTNHYPNDFNSGGPINMVNVELIEDIKFSTGGFISKYGDKLSSVMQITTREGSRDKVLAGNTSLSFAGAGAVLEGGFGNGNGSWIVSVRKSYLDLISGAIGLTAVPKYYDGQFKLAYDLNNSHKLSMAGIYGHDIIVFEGDTDYKDEDRAGVVDSLGLRDIDVFHEQYAVGMTLSSIWNKSVYSTATLYYNSYKSELDVREQFSRRTFDSEGYASYIKIKERPVFTQNSLNQLGGISAELVWNAEKNYEFSAGAFIGTGDYTNNSYINGDSVRYWTGTSWIEVQQPATVNKTDVEFFSQYKTYQYINNKISLFDERLELNVGLRYDYFSYSDQGNISPRASFSYSLISMLTHLNFSYGEYYQTQNYPTYGDRYNLNINKNLKNTYARHFVLGLDHNTWSRPPCICRGLPQIVLRYSDR